MLVFILSIILGCFIILSLFLFYVLLQYNYKARYKPCIYNLAINSQIPDTVKALINTIGFYLQDDLHIIIIQDDIKFLDSKFEWPKRAVYIHYSDVSHFLQKYSPNQKNYSLEEIGYFVKYKTKIY